MCQRSHGTIAPLPPPSKKAPGARHLPPGAGVEPLKEQDFSPTSCLSYSLQESIRGNSVCAHLVPAHMEAANDALS